MDVPEQEALLESYRSAREIRLARWRYRQRVAEVAAAGKECDNDASEALFGDTDEDNTKTAPRRHDNEEAGTSAGTAGNEEE